MDSFPPLSARIPGTFRIIHGFSCVAVLRHGKKGRFSGGKRPWHFFLFIQLTTSGSTPQIIYHHAPPRRTHYSPSQNGSRRLSPRFRFKSLIFLRRFSRHFCNGDVAQLPHTRIRKKNLLYDYNSSHFSPSSSSTLYGSRNVTLSRRKERRRCAYKFRGLSCLRKKSACYY